MPSFACQRRRSSSCASARSRALRSFFTAGATGSSPAVAVPGRGEYGKTCTFVRPGALDRGERARERGVVLGREADDHVARQVELVRERLEPAEVGGGRVAASHRAQDAVVAGLERDVEVARGGRRLAQRGDERVAHVVDLDRAEPQAVEARRRADLAHEARQVVAGVAVAEAAEVDPGEDDLAVPLLDAATHLAQDGVGARLRDAPRTSGITQKLHEKEQPSWIFTNARTRSSRASAWTQPIAPTSPATNAAVSSARFATTTTFGGQAREARSPRGSPRSR